MEHSEKTSEPLETPVLTPAYEQGYALGLESRITSLEKEVAILANIISFAFLVGTALLLRKYLIEQGLLESVLGGLEP